MSSNGWNQLFPSGPVRVLENHFVVVLIDLI